MRRERTPTSPATMVDADAAEAEAEKDASPGFQSPGVPFHTALPAAPAPHFPPQVSPFDPRVAHMLAMQAEQQARNSLSESYSYQAYAQQATAQLQVLRTAPHFPPQVSPFDP